MAYENTLRIQDVRALMRLTRDFHDTPTADGRFHLLADRLVHIFHAKVVFIAQGENISLDDPGNMKMLAEGGSIDAHERRLYDLYWAGEIETDPAYPPFRQHIERPQALIKQQLVTDEEWYGSDHFTDYRKANRLDEFIYASAPNGPIGTAVCIGVNREMGERPFNERERLMMELINQELVPYFRDNFRPTSQIIPKRQRQVLERLLHGESEKQVAQTIGISQETVHDHVKAIYKRFDVNARAELMSKLLLARNETNGDALP